MSSDSNPPSIQSSVSTERPPLAFGLRDKSSTHSSASPLVSVGTHSIATQKSSSSGLTSVSATNPPGEHAPVTVAARSPSSSASPASGGVLVGAAKVSLTPQNTQPRNWAPKLKKGDKLCWTKGRLLGRGAHGSVFLGLESTSGTLVAVKEMEFDPDDAALSERLASLQTELRLLKKLEHPNIVGYYSAARQSTSFLVFMEYVAGGSLASILDQFGRLQESLVMNFATQILTGLQYLHENQVVHSDIKCANVLISVDGIAKLADFGSARIIDDNAQVMNGDGGTAFWMAPEVIRQEQVTYSSDIWSFGCTVLEMLTNEIPFNFLGNAFSVMSFVARGEEAIELPQYVKQTLSPTAIDLVMSCLKRDPKQRATIRQLQEHDFFAPLRPPKQAFAASPPPPSPAVSNVNVVTGSVSSNLTQPSTARPGSQSSVQSSNIYIPPAIIAAVGVGMPPGGASVTSAADSNRTDVSEVQVRDHLVRKALRAVPGESNMGPLSSKDAVAEDDGATEGGNNYNSVSSLDTISLSEVSARAVSVVGGNAGEKVMTTSDVVHLMSSAMQDYVAAASMGTEATNGGSQLHSNGNSVPHPLHAISSHRSRSSSQQQPDEVITFVVEEEEDDHLVTGGNVEQQGNDQDGDDAPAIHSAGYATDDGSEGDEDDDHHPRKANKIQAVLLAVTSILVVVAVVLVIIFSNGQ